MQPPRCDVITPDTQLQVEPASAPRSVSLARSTATGFGWTILQTGITKGAALGSQLVLAWLLTPDEFGLIGLTLTTAAFASITGDAGISQILIQRQAELQRWIRPAMVLSLIIGLASGLLVAIAAPIAAKIMSEPRLLPLVLVIAASLPLAAIGVVPSAVAGATFRFKEIALVGTGCALASSAFAIIFAACGLGALSIVLAVPLTAAVRSAWFWYLVRPKAALINAPDTGRIVHLLPDSCVLIVSQFCLMLMHYGDYAVLGFFFEAAQVGLYFFAFQLSTQTMALLSASLGSVLFPVLSSLNADKLRQTTAYLRAARKLAIIAIPACFAQAMVAERLVYGIFPPKWIDSIAVLQILCIGMALRMVGSTAGNLIQAQGRFRFNLVLNAFYGTLYMIFCTIGALFGSIESTAIAASVFLAVLGFVHMWAAVAPAGMGFDQVLRVYCAPTLCAIAAVLPPTVIGGWLPVDGAAGIATMLGQLLLTVIIYVVIAARFLHADFVEVQTHIKRILNRVREPNAHADIT